MDADVKKMVEELEQNMQEYSVFLKAQIDKQLKDGHADVEELKVAVAELERLNKLAFATITELFDFWRNFVKRLWVIEDRLRIYDGDPLKDAEDREAKLEELLGQATSAEQEQEAEVA